jgi:hypothetical protein
MTTHSTHEMTKRRGVAGWVAALVAALVGVAAGIGVGFLLFSPKPMNADVDALVRDYVAAWDAGDGQAVMALMTDDATHTSFIYPSGITGDQIGAAVTTHEPSRFEAIGDVIVAGSAAPYEASNVVRITDRDSAGNYDPSGVEFVITYDIVEVDDQLLISNSTTMAMLDE